MLRETKRESMRATNVVHLKETAISHLFKHFEQRKDAMIVDGTNCARSISAGPE
jgi:hypothetical protein